MVDLSVVIPCYRSGPLLLEAVESALAQTIRVNVVICNDGSVDEPTLQALRSAEELGCRVIHQENAGTGAAINTACAETSSPYLLALASDDWIEPTYGARIVEVLAADDNVGIVTCHGEYFGKASGVFNTTPFSMGRMLHENTIHACSGFRKSDWAAVGGVPEHIRVLEDYGFWLRLLALGRTVVTVPEVLFHYRQSDTQITSSPGYDWSAAAAEIVRECAPLYAMHAEEFVAFRNSRNELLRHFKGRYGAAEDILSKLGTLHRLARGPVR